MNIVGRSSTALLAFSITCFALSFGSTARADLDSCLETFVPPPQNLNICERLIEELTVERVVPHETKSCDWSAAECAIGFFGGTPECCLPHACDIDPACYTIHTINETVQYVYHAGDVYCDPREVSAQDLLTKFSRRLLVDPKTGVPLQLTDPAAAPVVEALEATVAAVECASPGLSSSAKQVLTDLKNGFRGSFNEHGVSGGWTSAELSSVRITNEHGPLRDFLIDKDLRDAMTLGNLVIMKDAAFEALTSSKPPSAADLLEGRSTYQFIDAIDLMEHELVHVRQYREIGGSDFSYIYLAQLAEEGYDGAALEDEAYTFGSDVARERGGDYCKEQIDAYQYLEDKRDITLHVDPCAARPSALIWLASH
jgi:hypothetical protein